MRRISWHEYFMCQAKIIALRSSCQRAAVGSIITRDKRTIAAGYNGSVSGDVHCLDAGCKIEDGHCIRTVHSEVNAILQCAKFGVATEGTDIYVTHFPCLNCTKMIIQAGIQGLYYAEDYRVDPYALELLRGAEVRVKKVNPSLDTYLELSMERKDLISAILKELAGSGCDRGRYQELLGKAQELFGPEVG
ncbi:competence protein ComE [Clostridiales bacterium PH28_bin88]|nr:competence protein ComE [Clostridiales bacterium PH28_bin88]